MRVELVQLSRSALAALALGDRAAAETTTGFELTDYMVSTWHSTWQRRAAVAELLNWACREDAVTIVRATVRPDNTPS